MRWWFASTLTGSLPTAAFVVNASAARTVNASEALSHLGVWRLLMRVVSPESSREQPRQSPRLFLYQPYFISYQQRGVSKGW